MSLSSALSVSTLTSFLLSSKTSTKYSTLLTFIWTSLILHVPGSSVHRSDPSSWVICSHQKFIKLFTSHQKFIELFTSLKRPSICVLFWSTERALFSVHIFEITAASSTFLLTPGSAEFICWTSKIVNTGSPYENKKI